MCRKVITSANVLSEILDKLNPTAMAVYAMVIGHRNGKTGECYVTQATIAEETKMSLRTVKRSLSDLREAGFLDWKQGSSFSSKANSYIFPMETFDAEGIGQAIEVKKMKAKNKEEKIKKNMNKKVEAPAQKPVRSIPKGAPKAPANGPKPIMPNVNSMKKPPMAPPTIKKQEIQNIKPQASKDIKKLLAEYHNILDEHNSLVDASLIIPPTYADAVEHHSKIGNEEMALNLINYGIEEAKRYLERAKAEAKAKAEKVEDKAKVNFEKMLESITAEEAKRIYESWKDELDAITKSRVLDLMDVYAIKDAVRLMKESIEKKGKTFNIERNAI